MNREEIERELATLPKGTVTYKRINGKDQPYLQWSEGGKTKSRYLRLSERDVVMAQVARRRELQALLEASKKGDVPATRSFGISLDTFEMNVTVGEALAAFGGQVAGLKHRSCYQLLWNYLEDQSPRVCAVYGLRRTGKTTMLAQVVHDMTDEQRAATAYIKCRSRDDMSSLNRDLRRLQALAFRYVLIDEVTLLSDFITDSAVLSDVFAAQGMRIILSGTDSLSFWLARQDELYDRVVMIHTTHIPFREHSYLLGTDDVDEYIAYGGTLRQGVVHQTGIVLDEDLAFADDESAHVYVDTSISKNIQRSLMFYAEGGHFTGLAELYHAGELTSAINRIIEDMNHRFVREVVMGPFKSHDYGITARNLRSSADPTRRTSALDYLDRQAITESLMRRLDIIDSRLLEVDVREEHLAELHSYLGKLDLIGTCDIEVAGGNRMPGKRVIFTQPGMRFCQAEALVSMLMDDPDFAGLPERECLVITRAILDEVRGRMLEDIVLYETARVLPRGKRAFKLMVETEAGSYGEFDLAIYDSERDECQLFEVKHSTERVPEEQCRHLANGEMIASCERRFGKVVSRTVLYRGEDAEVEGGITYRNVETYLKGLAPVGGRL